VSKQASNMREESSKPSNQKGVAHLAIRLLGLLFNPEH
jgi:hypothetical protein